MSLTKMMQVQFGSNYDALDTVFYQLKDTANVNVGGQVVIGAGRELAQGTYAYPVVFSDGFHGSILWDSGDGSRQASEPVDLRTQTVNLADDAVNEDTLAESAVDEIVAAIPSGGGGSVIE